MEGRQVAQQRIPERRAAGVEHHEPLAVPALLPVRLRLVLRRRRRRRQRSPSTQSEFR